MRHEMPVEGGSIKLPFTEFRDRQSNSIGRAVSKLRSREMHMKPSDALHSNRAEIRRVVEAHRARNARVFGSVLHGQDTDGSDLDILIDPTPETTLFDIGAIRHELGRLLGVPVDVLTPNALPDSFRARVIAEARPV